MGQRACWVEIRTHTMCTFFGKVEISPESQSKVSTHGPWSKNLDFWEAIFDLRWRRPEVIPLAEWSAFNFRISLSEVWKYKKPGHLVIFLIFWIMVELLIEKSRLLGGNFWFSLESSRHHSVGKLISVEFQDFDVRSVKREHLDFFLHFFLDFSIMVDFFGKWPVENVPLGVNRYAPLEVEHQKLAEHRCTLGTTKLSIALQRTQGFPWNPYNFEAFSIADPPVTTRDFRQFVFNVIFMVQGSWWNTKNQPNSWKVDFSNSYMMNWHVWMS